MKLGIQLGLALVVLLLAYLVYDSVNSSIVFNDLAKQRKDVVVDRLKDVRMAQIAYKSVNGKYADNFDTLMNFINNGRLPMIFSIGDAEDSVQVAQGLVVRDTTYVPVKDSLYSKTYLATKVHKFYLDSLPYIPFSGGEKFKIAAGEILKNNVSVKVFEISCLNPQFLRGLDYHKFDVKKDEGLTLGSMTEPSTNGNWE